MNQELHFLCHSSHELSTSKLLSASLLRWGGLLLKALSVILSCDGPGFVIFLKTHGDFIFLLFDFRIRVYKSFSRGSKMERVFSGIPDAKSIKETFNKPSSKQTHPVQYKATQRVLSLSSVVCST